VVRVDGVLSLAAASVAPASLACRVDGVAGVAASTRPSRPSVAGSIGPRRSGADAVAACADVDARRKQCGQKAP